MTGAFLQFLQVGVSAFFSYSPKRLQRLTEGRKIFVTGKLESFLLTAEKKACQGGWGTRITGKTKFTPIITLNHSGLGMLQMSAAGTTLEGPA